MMPSDVCLSVAHIGSKSRTFIGRWAHYCLQRMASASAKLRGHLPSITAHWSLPSYTAR